MAGFGSRCFGVGVCGGVVGGLGGGAVQAEIATTAPSRIARARRCDASSQACDKCRTYIVTLSENTLVKPHKRQSAVREDWKVAKTRGMFLGGFALAALALLGGCSNLTPQQQRVLSGGAIGSAAGLGIAALSGGSLLAGGVIGAAGGAVIGAVAPSLGR